MGIAISFIPGLMFGIEFLLEEGLVFIDLGILRFMIGMINDQ